MHTFVIVDCEYRKNTLVTNSARKAKEKLYIGSSIGSRIEVWNNNGILIETIYFRNINKICKYIRFEKEYIGKKQAEAEQRNGRKGK